jgi:hypothetical protein
MCVSCGGRNLTATTNAGGSGRRQVSVSAGRAGDVGTVAPVTLPPPLAPWGTGDAYPGDARIDGVGAVGSRTTLLGAGSAAGAPAVQEVERVYETYLFDLSGLDDNLNRSWVPPLAEVATSGLGDATVRAAAAILRAREHGMGMLRDDQVVVKITDPSSASLVDCQDEKDFYLVDDATGRPDPAITRADFVGTAQLVNLKGRWYVSAFATTHVRCTY